ncbi:MAG: reverse transcriptase/maturase family protein [Candidatus Staskawiczbacteria bacterium]|nr:reverse transcriptase/maturase family protein [Candidatus Staskawiczbacteria bacterium]
METIFTKEKIFKAYRGCRETKKNTANALKFEINREKNLFELLNELQSKSYKISRHICFIVTQPKPREIFAADFRDRVVHHMLCNEIYNLFEEGFIENSFANRVGKGTHKGVEKLKVYINEENNSNYLKLDIKSFFCSINKDILYKTVSEKIIGAKKPDYWKKEILWLCQKVIYHNPTENYIFRGDINLKKLIPKEKSLFYSNGKGLPIGNLTSQFFANVYLDKLDQFIYDLGFKYYVRYVDDFIILGDRKIIYELQKIKEFLKKELDLVLSEKKIVFQSTKVGIDFLGYYIKPSHVLVRRKVVARFRSKINFLNFADTEKTLATVNSYFGHFGHANSYNLRKYSCIKLLSKLSEKLSFDKKYKYLKINKLKKYGKK